MRVPRPRILIAVALASMAALLPLAVSGQAAAVTYRAALVGANEVPPTASTATGTFTANLDEAAGTLTWTLSVPALTNATAAHLHQGAQGANGGVILPLFQAPAGAPAGAITVIGTARAADLAGPLAGNFANFVTALKAGNIYANAHTSANPGGEIRGVVFTGATPPAAAPVAAAAAVPTQATPAAPKTGNAGQLDGTASAAVTAALLLLAGGIVVGSRLYGTRRH
ncbi:MAG: CHRD domain-containing protein [Chloroflexi bacterium]|nr:MAG: CHRD domain-containing protein [Chloroflexota bacterium]